MRANITVYPPFVGFLGCLTAPDLRSGVPSKEKLSRASEVPTGDEVVGFDAYKLAVLVSVGVAVLSLCL
jgi:hypothetical protein